MLELFNNSVMCLSWTVWGAMAGVTRTFPPETSCRQTVWGRYLKTEELSTSAPLSDCLIGSFLQCPSDIKKKRKKKLHSVNAEQIKGNVPLTLPHWGLETGKISAPLLCTDLPGKIIFLDWCGILSWRICSYGNVIASGSGTATFTASRFSSRSTGGEAGNTGDAAKSQFPLGNVIGGVCQYFLNCISPFSVQPSQILWADARKQGEQCRAGLWEGYPGFWCLPAVWTAAAGDGRWSQGRCWGLGLHQSDTLPAAPD